MKENIERILQMETLLNNLTDTLNSTEGALENLTRAARDIKTLRDYYTSPAWRADFAADEEGKLPPDLRRGVLSQDGIDTLLWQYKQLLERMHQFPDALEE